MSDGRRGRPGRLLGRRAAPGARGRPGPGARAHRRRRLRPGRPLQPRGVQPLRGRGRRRETARSSARTTARCSDCSDGTPMSLPATRPVARLRRARRRRARAGGGLVTSTLAIAGLRGRGRRHARAARAWTSPWSPGEVHVIMGPNGSGKSTLAHALAGHPGYRVVAGTVTLDGVDLLSLSPTQRARHGLLLALQHPLEVPGVRPFDLLVVGRRGPDGPRRADARRGAARRPATRGPRALRQRRPLGR